MPALKRKRKEMPGREIASRHIPIYHPFHDYFDRFFDISPFHSWMSPFEGFWGEDYPKTYSIYIDVGRDYKPEDITSKVENGKLKVKGKTHKKDQNGSSSHEFERDYDLPKDIVDDSIQTELDRFGGLTVMFKRKKGSQVIGYEDLSKDDMYHYKLKVEGFKPDEISVTSKGNAINIEADHKHEHTNEDGTSHYSHSGHYLRSIHLGNDFKEDTLKAKFNKDGTLEIMANRDPKLLSAGPKKLDIEYEK